MLVCRVTGQAVSTVKCEGLRGFKLLVCLPLPLDVTHSAGDVAVVSPTSPHDGHALVAVDLVGAGEGDVVGVIVGEPARHAAGVRAPVDAAVVAIFDHITIEGQVSGQAAGVKA